MVKKIIYVLVIIALIVAGIFLAKKITADNETKPTTSNTVENTNKQEEVNTVEENNIETPVENEVNNNTQTGEEAEAPEEIAKQMVMENWGEDELVYFSYDGQDENGKYIICVREKATTKALYWYYVDIETGTLDIQ